MSNYGADRRSRCRVACFVAIYCISVSTAVTVKKTPAAPSQSLVQSLVAKAGLIEICEKGSSWWKTVVEQNKKKHSNRTLYHLHIPKTAGTSFAGDIKKIVGDNMKVDSHEGCFGDSPHARAGVVTMLRHPRDHVLSQYTFCATSTDKGPKFIQDTMPSTFGSWLQEWSRLRKEGRAHRDFSVAPSQHNQPWCSNLPFKCYSPLNLQSQRFTCETANKYSDKLNVDRAVENMQASFFVGIVEAYQESMCLLHAKTLNTLPTWCNCKDEKARKETGLLQASHGTVSHSVQDVPKELLQDVDSFTEGDRELYRAAVHRFMNETREVEERHGVKILCPTTKIKLRKLTKLGPHA